MHSFYYKGHWIISGDPSLHRLIDAHEKDRENEPKRSKDSEPGLACILVLAVLVLYGLLISAVAYTGELWAWLLLVALTAGLGGITSYFGKDGRRLKRYTQFVADGVIIPPASLQLQQLLSELKQTGRSPNELGLDEADAYTARLLEIYREGKPLPS